LSYFLQRKIDEVNALVIDVGTACTKAGYAGEDAPKTVFSSWVGSIDGKPQEQQEKIQDVPMKDVNEKEEEEKAHPKSTFFVGDGSSMLYREGMDMKNPLKDGLGILIASLLCDAVVI
jgi:actin-related protein